MLFTALHISVKTQQATGLPTESHGIPHSPIFVFLVSRSPSILPVLFLLTDFYLFNLHPSLLPEDIIMISPEARLWAGSGCLIIGAS